MGRLCMSLSVLLHTLSHHTMNCSMQLCKKKLTHKFSLGKRATELILQMFLYSKTSYIGTCAYMYMYVCICSYIMHTCTILICLVWSTTLCDGPLEMQNIYSTKEIQKTDVADEADVVHWALFLVTINMWWKGEDRLRIIIAWHLARLVGRVCVQWLETSLLTIVLHLLWDL